jgi:glutaredoxin/glutathione-dependent peroxiredoxin
MKESAMSIAVGQSVPQVNCRHMTADGPQSISTADIFNHQTVVLFSVPGAFTPTCSARHLPGFVDLAAQFKAKGVDRLVCLAVNDPFVMGAWGKHANVNDQVLMLADGNGEFTKALGLELDGTGFGLGMRGQRFALVAKNGVVSHLFVEKAGEFKVSSAEHVLAAL